MEEVEVVMAVGHGADDLSEIAEHDRLWKASARLLLHDDCFAQVAPRGIFHHDA